VLANGLSACHHPAHWRDEQSAHHRLYQPEFDQPCLVRLGDRGADEPAADAGQRGKLFRCQVCGIGHTMHHDGYSITEHKRGVWWQYPWAPIKAL